jgi:hypothetical protein
MTGPFGLVPRSWGRLDLTDLMFRILVILASYADPRRGGIAYPSQETLAADARCTRETVCRSLNFIAETYPEVLRIEKRGKRCIYYLPELARISARTSAADPEDAEAEAAEPEAVAAETPVSSHARTCEPKVIRPSPYQKAHTDSSTVPPRARPEVEKIEIPEGWWPTAEMLADALKARPDLNLFAVTRKFVTKSRAFGWRFTSPEEAYRWFIETEFPREIRNERPAERGSTSRPTAAERTKADNEDRDCITRSVMGQILEGRL